MKRIDKNKLWKYLEDYLGKRKMSISGGEIEELKDSLFEDFKLTKELFPRMSVESFIEAFVEELLEMPIQVSDKVIVPSGQ